MEGDKEKRNKFDKKKKRMFWRFQNSSYLCIRKREICILVKLQEFFLK